MTEQELTIYRLRLRVALLERVCYSLSIGLLMRAGATLDQARNELVDSIERGKNEMVPGIPSYPDPAQHALAHDEFREIVENLKQLARSYQ